MDYKERYREWSTSDYFDDAIKEELLSIKDNDYEINDRFSKELSFGTGGLRGIMGAGTNRINSYTVEKVSMGLGQWIKSYKQIEPSVVIAYDTRNNSKEFAEDAASVFSVLGIKVYLFDRPMATPVLSYAVRHLQCDAGVVITASHNPKEYNGYKVYDHMGGQLTPKKANEVIKYIEQVNGFNHKKKSPEKSKLIKVLSSEVLDSFINEVSSQSRFHGELNVIYTPLHGAGNIPVRRALKDYNVSVVKKQELPDGDFSTVISPNPEDENALRLAINQAKEEDGDLVIGTDPDCDRVGVAVKHNNRFELLTGNQIGALLVDFVIEKSEINEKTTLLKTIVTNDLGANIARKKGLNIIETLTGFKYIGEKINEFETSPNSDYEFLIGYEESYGYLVGTHSRDKDAVVSALLICEMTAYYKSQGFSLIDRLHNIYEEYGYYLDDLDSITLNGQDGSNEINEVMNEVRRLGINCFNDIKVLKDYALGIDNLPKENVIKFFFNDGSWIAIRPSGTEPKFKIYYSIQGDNKYHAQKKLGKIKEQIQEKLKLRL